jgi:endonuclease/exonuclease/phosphatase family metal-dependent hydrolase
VKNTLWFRGYVSKGAIFGIILAIISTHAVSAQVLMSAGTYTQNFDALASTGTANPWTDNVTLPGWYAATNLTSIKSGTVTLYNAGTGSSTAGALYSFGDSGSTDRALGSLASGGLGNLACGVRLTNDTAFAQTNFMVSYTGEQWRVANTNTQTLAFAYQIGASLTNADAANVQSWTPFAALNFNSPTTNGTARALAGNDPTNQVIFTNVFLAGVVVQPGQELFLRWQDPDDASFDDALAIDNLTVSFQATNAAVTGVPPNITTQPESQAVTEGDTVTFTVVAGGTAPLSYQWQSNNVAVAGATNDTLVLASVTTNFSGSAYFVTITNAAGATNSQTATLTVAAATAPANNTLTVMTYNVKGNGTTNWSTNALQVQAIGRQLIYLQPDIVTFNEIPRTNMWQMPNWVAAFLPGYYLATNSIGDGFIQSCIVSRYPILNSASHLHSSSLIEYDASVTSGFTRDLFEAQIAVSNYPVPLHVFITHLKATTSSPQSDADKRAAEASAVSNYLATVHLAGTNGLHPYLLTGDQNEDVFRPATGDYTTGQPIQRLTSLPAGLRLTTPVNPYDNSSSNDMTISIQATRLTARFDYILPCALLYSNIVSSQVFRTDRLSPLPPTLNSNDNKVASDHLPVLMVFANPYTQPFRLTSIARSNSAVTLQWGTVPGQAYRVECSSNLAAWTTLADRLTATNYNYLLNTNRTNPAQFFRVRRLN